MGTKSHFRVVARLDSSSRISGTVTIDRCGGMWGLFTVRPYRRRRTFELPLAAVADMVVARVVRAEVLARRLAKKKS